MLIYIGDISEKYYYGVYNLIKMLYPKSKITRDKAEKADISFEFEITETDVFVICNGKTVKKEIVLSDVSLTLKKCIYEISDKKLPFGVFTGIRPTKVILRYNDGGKIFKEEFCADEKKVRIASKCADVSFFVSKKTLRRSTALYINIPFCPTRCAYCSFVSVKYSKNIVKSYFEALMYELKEIVKTIKENKISVLCVYIGGGTPTILETDMLSELCFYIRNSFPNVKEFTVEAGRPDTLTLEKLTVMKNAGVSRISINPQTLNDKTLSVIGRKHTKDDFLKAYNMAVSVGIDSINTDIIAGLSGETTDDFKNTVDEILKLSPQSITVHTLCKKKNADMEEADVYEGYGVEKMLDYVYDKLENRYSPYYMYRQKNSAGSLENTGFVNNGDVCEYNVIMMEEIASVIGIGAGSASKLIDFESKKPFSKIRNDKTPHRYISDIVNITEKKRSFLENGKDRI